MREHVKLTRLKTPDSIDDSHGHRGNAVKNFTKNRRLIAILFTMVFFSMLTNFIQAVVVSRTAQPKTNTILTYINDDGVLVSEESVSSIPTIWMSERFIEGCMRKLFTLDSSGYESQMQEARYCFNDVSFKETSSDIVNKIIYPLFVDTRARGRVTAENISTSFIYNSRLAPSDTNCSQRRIDQFDNVVDCRRFEVSLDLDATFFEKDKGTRTTRSFFIDLYILPRAYASNGMYIYLIGDNKK